jgi:hypothetical protein
MNEESASLPQCGGDTARATDSFHGRGRKKGSAKDGEATPQKARPHMVNSVRLVLRDVRP